MPSSDQTVNGPAIATLRISLGTLEFYYHSQCETSVMFPFKHTFFSRFCASNAQNDGSIEHEILLLFGIQMPKNNRTRETEKRIKNQISLRASERKRKKG